MNCEEVDLPPIPDHLIKDLTTIETYKDHFNHTNKDYKGTYSSYSANEDLVEYLSQYFDHPITVRYQVIRRELPVHIDKTVQDTKLNYIIDPAGDVKTQWWTTADETKELVEEHVLETGKWYKLNIKVPHSITSLLRERVSITVKENIDA